MTARRLIRPIAALLLIPAALYALYLGWRNWGMLAGGLAELLFEREPARGAFRGSLDDFRLVIEVLIVFAAADVVERILSLTPTPAQHNDAP